jgi:hypothetical protein
MARTRKWFLLGTIGALIGVLTKLVRGRQDPEVADGRWEGAQPWSGSGPAA